MARPDVCDAQVRMSLVEDRSRAGERPLLLVPLLLFQCQPPAPEAEIGQAIAQAIGDFLAAAFLAPIGGRGGRGLPARDHNGYGTGFLDNRVGEKVVAIFSVCEDY